MVTQSRRSGHPSGGEDSSGDPAHDNDGRTIAMQNSRTIALAAIAGVILLSSAADAQRRDNRCSEATAAEIARLQIDPARIGAISYRAQRKSGGDDGGNRTTRVLAWVDLVDCTGNLVIDLTPSCIFKQAYTTDECTVEGLSSC